MKKLFKRLFKTAFFRFLIVWAAAMFIRFVYYTCRHRWQIDPASKPYMSGEKNVIFAFWHGRLMMMPLMNPSNRKMNVMISQHRDGEMIAQTMHRFGFATIRGSTSKGGVMAGRGAIRAAKDGQNVSITPDGPRGPAEKVQEGIVTISSMTGVPIVPITFSASRHKRARSWDRFMIALPFGTLYYAAGAPLWNATAETLEEAMKAINRDVDSHVPSLS